MHPSVTPLATIFRLNTELLLNCLDFGGPDSDLVELRNRAALRRPLEALARLSPAEKEAKGRSTMILTGVLSLGALLVGAVAWFVHRSTSECHDP